VSDLLADGRFEAGDDPLRPEAAALLAAWARRVRADAEQVERFGERHHDSDYYGPIADRFRADPRRTDDPPLDALLTLARPDETWLEVGAGGGRYTLPLALATREVIAVEPSPGMLGVLREGLDEHRIRNVRPVEGRWPAAAGPDTEADVALIAHVGYDVEQIGPFLDALELSARRLCVAMLYWRRPSSALDRLWPAVHGVERAPLPELRDLVTLLMARGRPVDVRLLEQAAPSFGTPDRVLEQARHQTWVRPGSDADRRLEAALRERPVEREERFAFDWAPAYLGLLTWTPGASTPLASAAPVALSCKT
jgi:SAM-dependent methyltransferase